MTICRNAMWKYYYYYFRERENQKSLAPDFCDCEVITLKFKKFRLIFDCLKFKSELIVFNVLFYFLFCFVLVVHTRIYTTDFIRISPFDCAPQCIVIKCAKSAKLCVGQTIQKLFVLNFRQSIETLWYSMLTCFLFSLRYVECYICKMGLRERMQENNWKFQRKFICLHILNEVNDGNSKTVKNVCERKQICILYVQYQLRSECTESSPTITLWKWWKAAIVRKGWSWE